MALLFVPKETAPNERRVAATPETVRKFVKDGHRVLVQAGAGALAYYGDADYVAAGATIAATAAEGWAAADIVGKLHPPTPDEVSRAREGASIVAFLWPLERIETVRALSAKKLSVFAMDALPRTTRAQKADALTSQASLAGYKAVLLAAASLPKIFPMQMTPAGTIRPARVLILGAGVAGLQAIATARRLGAIVEVSDVRPEVKEQVQSLGATYLEATGAGSPGATGTSSSAPPAADKDGYATAQSEEFQRRQREMLAEHIAASDVVITTALIPGRPAPRLIAADVVRRMRAGSVIVDLAAERGGNVEGTEAGKTVVKDGVTILGEVNLAASVPTHASDQYAKNVMAVIADATKKGVFAWDLKDEVVAGALVLHAGEVRHAKSRDALGLPPLPAPPPPPAPPSAPTVTAAPSAAPAPR
jgi:H+-translocating NAD(P) transhydrogenase subunit alpha